MTDWSKMLLHNTVPGIIKNSDIQCTISCFTFYRFPLSTFSGLGVGGGRWSKHDMRFLKAETFLLITVSQGPTWTRPTAGVREMNTQGQQSPEPTHPSPNQHEALSGHRCSCSAPISTSQT